MNPPGSAHYVFSLMGAPHYIVNTPVLPALYSQQCTPSTVLPAPQPGQQNNIRFVQTAPGNFKLISQDETDNNQVYAMDSHAPILQQHLMQSTSREYVIDFCYKYNS
jgi:hypothetical protein